MTDFLCYQEPLSSNVPENTMLDNVNRGSFEDSLTEMLSDKAAGMAFARPRMPEDPDDLSLHWRALLVEDNQDHQPLLSQILRETGYGVSIAENGQLAVELARTVGEQGRPFDIILMDVQMPILDGLDATRMLRSAGVTCPIIAVTARAMSDDRQKCLDAGCNDFVAKPFNVPELVRLLASHLETTRPETASPETASPETASPPD